MSSNDSSIVGSAQDAIKTLVGGLKIASTFANLYVENGIRHALETKY